MSASAAKIGKGTTLGHRAFGTSGAFTTLAEVFDLPFPELEHADVEVTHYTSDNGMEEFVNGWATGQDMEIQMNYTPAAYAAVLALRGTKANFKITLPGGATLIFDANVKKVGGAVPNKDRITNSITLKPTSVPEFDDGSSS